MKDNFEYRTASDRLKEADDILYSDNRPNRVADSQDKRKP
jgi:hypothetical protein